MQQEYRASLGPHVVSNTRCHRQQHSGTKVVVCTPGRRGRPGHDIKFALKRLDCHDTAGGVLGESGSSVEHEEGNGSARTLEERLLPMAVLLGRFALQCRDLRREIKHQVIDRKAL
ncbi:MAG: hypothetical protein AB7O77_09325 [Phycisphaerales bacterium]